MCKPIEALSISTKPEEHHKKRSASLGAATVSSYSTESIRKSIEEAKTNVQMYTHILDQIRNYRELTTEQLERLDSMTDGSKMFVIREYNRVLKMLTDSIEW